MLCTISHFTDENEKQMIDQWGNSNNTFRNFRSNARGVAEIFNKNLDHNMHKK